MYFKSLLIAAVTLGLVACTKDATPTSHEAAVNTKIQNQDDLSDLETKFKSWDLAALHRRIETERKSNPQDVKELAPWILTDEALNHPRIVLQPKWAEALSLFNWILVAGKSQGLAERSAWLEKYEKAVFFGCDSQNKGCTRLALFQRDPLSAELLAEIAQTKSDVQEYYRIMNAAYDISVQGRSKEFTAAFSRRSEEYQSILKENLSAQNQDLLDHHRRVLAAQRHVLEKNVSANDFIKSLPAIKMQIEKLKNDISPDAKQDPKSRAHLLKLTPIENVDAVVAFHSYFEGQIGLKEMIDYHRTLKIDEKVVARSLDAYIQARFVRVLLTGHRLFSEAINGNQFDDEQFFQQIVFSTNQIGAQWRAFFSQTDSAAIAVRSLETLSEQTRDDLSLKLSRTRYNAKVYSLYPHMIALSYYVAKYNVVRKFSIFIFNFTETAEDLIRKLWFPGQNGNPAWFDYGTQKMGTDPVALTKAEIVDAFDMSLRSGLFEIMKIDVSDYLQRVFKATFATYSKSDSAKSFLSLPEVNEMLQSTYQYSTEWRDFSRQCDQIESKKPVTLQMDLDQIAQSPILGSSRSYMTSCNWSTMAKTNYLVGACPFFLVPNRAFETVRSGVRPTLFYTHMILNAYRDFLNSRGLSADQVKKALAPASQPAMDLQKISDDLVNKNAPPITKFLKCFPKIIQFENNTKMNLISQLEIWLAQAFDGAQTNPQQTQVALRKELSVGGYKSRIEVSLGRVKYSKFDIMMKVALLNQTLNPQIRITVPAKFADAETVATSYENPIDVVSTKISKQEFTHHVLVRAFGDNLNRAWMNWFSGEESAHDVLQAWTEGVTLLHRLDSQKFPVSLVLETAKSTYDLVHISDQQVEVLKKLGRPTMVNESLAYRFSDFFIHPTSGRIAGLYDKANALMLDDVLANFDRGPEDDETGNRQIGPQFVPENILPLLAQASDFARYEMARPQTLFQGTLDAANLFKAYYATEIATYKEAYLRFRSQVDSSLAPDQVRVRTNKVVPLEKLSTDEDLHYEQTLRNFKKVTSGFYDKEENKVTPEIVKKLSKVRGTN